MKKLNITLSVFILFSLFGVTRVEAQFSQVRKIVAENREGRAEYGTSVAIVEDFAIVGASRETIASGAAYVYSKDSQGNWSYSQRLAANDPNEGAEFGGGAKISDGYLVVAAGRANVGSTERAGALYVYDYQNNNWEFTTKLVASDLSGDAKLGMNPTSLDVEGNTIIGGAPGENGWTGSVYVFSKVGNTWTEKQKIFSPNPQVSETFGIGVSISGDYIVVGAEAGNNGKGAAFIYKRNTNGIWEYAQTLIPSDAAVNDYFGTSVSIHGDNLVVGAYGKNAEAGAAYIFQKDSQGMWLEVQKLNANSSAPNTQFGWSTEIQQNYLIVSAPRIYGSEKGEVYFYKKDNLGVWNEEQIIQGSDTTIEDVFGWSIAMYESELITGAPWADYDENGNNEMGNAGSAYIFNNPTILGGLADYGDKKNEVHLYPNPANDILNIQAELPISSVEIMNVLGQRLLKTKRKSNHEQIDISALSAGNYFVKVYVGDESRLLKLVKR